MSKKTAEILLVGNPNVGKSVIFNRLTGSDAVVSNYCVQRIGLNSLTAEIVHPDRQN